MSLNMAELYERFNQLGSSTLEEVDQYDIEDYRELEELNSNIDLLEYRYEEAYEEGSEFEEHIEERVADEYGFMERVALDLPQTADNYKHEYADFIYEGITYLVRSS